MTPDYVTVYQISAASCYSNWPFALAGVLPIFLGLLMIVLKLRFRTPRITWILPIAFCAFGFLWLFTVGWSLLADDANAWKRYQAGDYTTVEGPVQNFSPMPYEGHRNECFSVQSHQFCYSDYVMGAGFHQTASHGGPIRAGMVVRLAYSGDSILRVEIPREFLLSPQNSAAIVRQAEAQWQKENADDPVEKRLTIAFSFTVVCICLVFNFQWKRAMRFWIKPPYRSLTELIFRLLFLIAALSAVYRLGSELYRHAWTPEELWPTLWLSLAFSALAYAFYFGILSGIERRDRKRAI